MKQEEILTNTIPQDIEVWAKKNKGNIYYLDYSYQNYGELDHIDINQDDDTDHTIFFKPIVNNSYILDSKGLIQLSFWPKKTKYYDFLLKEQKTTISSNTDAQKENIKLHYYINQDHVNRVITIAQHHQKPKVTIEIDDYNDLEFATKIVNILNANL